MNKLSIPEKIVLEKEVTSNLRTKDVPKLLGLIIPGILIAAVVWITAAEAPMTQLITLIIAFSYTGLCYALVARIEGALSILDYLGLMVRFYREQQIYYYKEKKEVIYRVCSEEPAEDGSNSFH